MQSHCVPCTAPHTGWKHPSSRDCVLFMLNSLEGMCQPKVGLNEHFPVGVVLTVPLEL